jgi:hypothetical protein
MRATAVLATAVPAARLLPPPVVAAVGEPAPEPAVLRAHPVVRSELELIQEAQAAEPARALAVLRNHERAYPAGMLAQEREVLAIRSLLALDRRADAEARAARMAQRYPGSAQLRRVRVLLDEAPRQ